MGIRLKVTLIAVAVAVVLACAAGWYAIRHPDWSIPRICAYLHKDTGLQVRIQHLEIQLFPTLVVHVYGLEIQNSKPFPSGNFLRIPRLDATIERLPLLHGEIAIQSLWLHKPTIDFVSDPDGLWNFQNPSNSNKAPAHFSTTLIPRLRIDDGMLRGSNLVEPTDKPGPVVLDIGHFSVRMDQILSKPSDGSGKSAGLAGHFTADTARFGSIHTKHFQSDIRITSTQLVFNKVEAKAYQGRAKGDFSLNFGDKNTTFKTDLQVDDIGMPDVLAEFQKGTPAITGSMQASLSLAGAITHASNPLNGIHGTAQVTIRDGELPKLDHNPNMIALERFRPSGTGALSASAFTTFTADMELRNNHIYSKRIDVNFHGTDVVGSGNTSLLDGAVDYRGAANVQKKQGLMTNVFAQLFKEAHQQANGRLTFPLRLTGKLTSPTLSVVE